MKNKLIESTIKVIGEQGIEKATTKAICKSIGVNEVYIYRIFGSKEDLFKDAYTCLDSEFAGCLNKNFDILVDDSTKVEARWQKYIGSLWDFILSNQTRAMAYIYYYYSKYYATYSREKRVKTYTAVYANVKQVINIGSDFSIVFGQILDIIFSSVLKVFRNEEDSEVMKNRVCKLIFMIIKSYLKEE